MSKLKTIFTAPEISNLAHTSMQNVQRGENLFIDCCSRFDPARPNQNAAEHMLENSTDNTWLYWFDDYVSALLFVKYFGGSLFYDLAYDEEGEYCVISDTGPK